MPNLPLSHRSSQLFDLRAPSSTDVPVQLLTDWKSFCFVFFFFGGGGGGGGDGRRGKGISPLLPLLPTLDWDVRFCNSSLLFSAYAISSAGRPVGLCLKSLQHKRSATRCTLCQSQNRSPRKAWKSKVRLSATADQKC